VINLALYFKNPGPENTEKTIEEARRKVKELGIKYIVVPSITGDSAIKVAEKFKGLNVNIVCATVPQGMFWNVESMNKGPYAEISNLKKIRDEYRRKGLKKVMMGITKKNKIKLNKLGVKVVKGSVPLFGVSFSIRTNLGGLAELDLISKTLELFSTGTQSCVESTMMATDAGEVPEGEVIAFGGTERGLDTCWVLRASTSLNLFNQKNGFRFLELIAKPRVSFTSDMSSDYLKEK